MTFNHDENPVRSHIASIDSEILLITGFDNAIIGLSQRVNEPTLAVYSWEKIIEILMAENDMDIEDAMEYTEFNIIGAWMGERTPIIVMPLD